MNRQTLARHRAAFCVAVAFCCPLPIPQVPVPMLAVSTVPVLDGARSTVHLVEVARLSGPEASSLKPPAKDGLRFVFVAIRKPGVAGLATLAETRSFEVGGQRYPKPGLPPSEPETVLYDLAKFRKSIRTDLAARLPLAVDDASVVVVSIGGGELTTGAKARVKLVWGWDKATEDFWFDFAVPH